MVSMESEKRAVRDFHGGVKSEAKGEAFSTLDTKNDRDSPYTVGVDLNVSEFSQHPKTEIRELKWKATADTIPDKKKEIMRWMLPQSKSGFSNKSLFSIPRPDTHIPPQKRSTMVDESPPDIVVPNTEELQNIKNMILTLQLDLQEERTKRECLEEKVRKYEGDLTQKSHEISERKWQLSDMRVPKDEIPQNQFFSLGRNTTEDVDEKIG